MLCPVNLVLLMMNVGVGRVLGELQEESDVRGVSVFVCEKKIGSPWSTSKHYTIILHNLASDAAVYLPQGGAINIMGQRQCLAWKTLENRTLLLTCVICLFPRRTLHLEIKGHRF